MHARVCKLAVFIQKQGGGGVKSALARACKPQGQCFKERERERERERKKERERERDSLAAP